MPKRVDQNQHLAIARKVRWIVAGLIALALAIAGTRLWLAAIRPPAPAGSAWLVHLEFRLHADRAGATVTLAPPWDSPAARLYSQQLTLDGLQLDRTRDTRANPRRIATRALRSGELALTADFSIRRFARTQKPRPERATLEPDERQRYLGQEPGIDPASAEVHASLDRINAAATGNGDLVPRIYRYVRGQLSASAANGADTAAAALASGHATALGRVRAMVTLCRAAGLPARVVTGFLLAEQNHVQPRYWTQVYRQGQWTDYDPTQGFEGRLPDSYVAFSRDGPLLRLDHAALVDADYQISEEDVPASIAGTASANPLTILDLSRLPLSARATLATLLLLPLGALLNTVVRSLVGVQTFGTFTPAMLALAAIYVDWLTALVIFVVVAVIGLFGRAMLPGLKLARAPRLTIVFALVALAMALAVSIMAYADLLTGVRVVLLPIVILTSLVDRVYSVMDEQGLHTTLIRMLWTGITAIGCFFILGAESLGEWLIRYPEAHLVTIALVLALAVYRGPQLARFPGLRWLGEPKRVVDKANDGD